MDSSSERLPLIEISSLLMVVTGVEEIVFTRGILEPVMTITLLFSGEYSNDVPLLISGAAFNEPA